MNVTFNEVYVPRFSGVGEDSVAKWLRTGEGPQFYLPDSLLCRCIALIFYVNNFMQIMVEI